MLVPGEDVVWLEVPHTSLPDGNNDVNTRFNGQNLGFAVDSIQALLNRDFAEQNPAAREFLARVQITTEDESAQNLRPVPRIFAVTPPSGWSSIANSSMSGSPRPVTPPTKP